VESTQQGRRRVDRLALSFVWLVILAFSWTPGIEGVAPQSDRSFKMRVNVELVTAEVTVLDKQGIPVHNLKKEDFRIYEDGKQQEIASFDEVNERSGQTLEASFTGPMGAKSGKIVLFLFDDRTIDTANIKEVRDSAEKFVRDHMQPRDLFAVVSNGLSLGVLQNLTDSSERIVAAVRKVVMPGGMPSSMGSRTSSGSGINFIRALDYLCQSVERIKGRKFVLLFSGSIGLVPSWETHNLYLKTVDSARKANVIFITIEPKRTDSSLFSEGPAMPSGNNRYPAMGRGTIGGAENPADYLRTLASDTGGFSIYNAGELDSALDALDRQMSNYYVLGFQSGNPKRDGSFREIEVKTNLKNVTLKCQKGYVDRRPLDTLNSSKQEKVLLEAMASSAAAIQLPLSFRPLYFYDSPRLARVVIPARIRLDKAEFRKKGGQMTCDVNVMGAAYAENDTVAARFSQVVHVTAYDEKGRDAGKEFDYRNYFKLRPGKYRLKLAASDGANHLGSTEHLLEIPAIPENGLAASSLVVAESAFPLPALIENLEARLLDDDDPLVYAGLQISPSIANRLSVRSLPAVLFKIYNPAGDLEPWRAVAKAKLLRESGEEISLPPVSIEKELSPSDHAQVTIALNLPFRDVRPGKYKLTIEVIEAGSSRTAVAQADIEFAGD
jgi:VWFA-related protein